MDFAQLLTPILIVIEGCLLTSVISKSCCRSKRVANPDSRFSSIYLKIRLLRLSNLLESCCWQKYLMMEQTTNMVSVQTCLIGVETLTEHRQRVVGKWEASDWLTVTSGDPQGSLLGPLFSIVYINDLPGTISKNSSNIMSINFLIPGTWYMTKYSVPKIYQPSYLVYDII